MNKAAREAHAKASVALYASNGSVKWFAPRIQVRVVMPKTNAARRHAPPMSARFRLWFCQASNPPYNKRLRTTTIAKIAETRWLEVFPEITPGAGVHGATS